jgi:hypothetical protein
VDSVVGVLDGAPVVGDGGEAISPVTEPLLTAVADSVGSTGYPPEPVLAGIGDAAFPALESLTEGVPAVDPLAATVTGAGETIVAANGPAAPIDVGETLEVATGPAVEPFVPPQLGDVPTVALADPPAIPDPAPIFDPTDVLALDPADQRLLITAAVVAVTGLAFTPTGLDIAREACAANARIVFSNMRLLPCVAEDAVRRYAAAATEAISRQTSRPASRPASGDGSSAALTRVPGEALEAIKEGFDRVTRDLPAEAGDEQDRRILAQVGVVLGLVYLAFLTLWFWATRLRWRPHT